MIALKTISPVALEQLLKPYTNPLTGIWYRAIQLRHAATALSYAHSAGRSSRFSPAAVAGKPGFSLIYLAENHQVALWEVQALLGSPGSGLAVANPRSAWAVLNINVRLNAIVDLSDVRAVSFADHAAGVDRRLDGLSTAGNAWSHGD